MQAMEAVTLEARRVLVAACDIQPSDHKFPQFFSIRAGGMGLSIFRSISQWQEGCTLASSNDRLGIAFQFTLALRSENVP